MSRPSELHKAVASDLATLLPITEENQQKAYDLMEKLGYTRPEETEEETLEEDPFKSHIGIYKPEIKDGKKYYHRDILQKGTWSFFADVQTIPPKSDKKRIVLLGESVTRGFLLDPEYTPAIVLDQLLKSYKEEVDYEIIDLAETNLGMAGIKERYIQCMALEPDMVVFLAGNNWREDLLFSLGNSPEKLQALQELMQGEDGIAAVKPLIEEYFSDLVDDFLGYVSNISKENNVPVLFTIPEYNLLDCKSTPAERIVSELPYDKLKTWIEAKEIAVASLASGNLDLCMAEAKKMVDVDPSHPYGFELLADCSIKKEQYEEARHYFELARDTALFCRTNSKPRTFKIVQQTILAKAENHGIKVIDLPTVFKAHLGGKVPGRDLFLDYCHFSVEGIQIAMEAVYKVVLQEFNDTRKTHKEVTSIIPSNEGLALGHLFAAIHNAHWGQSYDILLHHCSEALSKSKDIAKTMVYYCDMISRSAANNVCKSLEKILEDNTKLDRYVHALIPGRNMKNMELELVDAMTTVLKSNGVDITNYLLKIRLDEHNIKNRRINLLQNYYHATSYDEYQGQKTAFFQARDTKSDFFVIADTNSKAQLTISLRIPKVINESNDEVTLLVNDKEVRKLAVGHKWQTYTVDIPTDFLVNGTNVFKIKWPLVATKKEVQNNGSSTAILDAAFRVFGEICNMTVSGV
jgi:tetratricopeptide (TPR) repeat protein